MFRRLTAVAAASATIATVVATLAAVPALADTSGTVKLNGTVSLSCTVAVTDSNASLNITSGSTNVQVGSVVENCNDGSGYTITVSSANGGSLKSSATGASAISYTTNYDGTSGSGSSFTVNRSSAQFAKTSAMYVTVPANSQAIAGTYSDTLTVTIAGK